jgi:hypothetical protein
MTKILTTRDWNELWDESEANGQTPIQPNSFEIIYKKHFPELGSSCQSWMELRNG